MIKTVAKRHFKMCLYLIIEVHYYRPKEKIGILCMRSCPGPPTPIEPGGTYAHYPSPEPPYLGKRISKVIAPYLGYWLPLAITKTPLFLVFSGNLPETTARNTPFPEKMGTRMRPPYAVHSSGGPGDHAQSAIKQLHVAGKKPYIVP